MHCSIADQYPDKRKFGSVGSTPMCFSQPHGTNHQIFRSLKPLRVPQFSSEFSWKHSAVRMKATHELNKCRISDGSHCKFLNVGITSRDNACVNFSYTHHYALT